MNECYKGITGYSSKENAEFYQRLVEQANISSKPVISPELWQVMQRSIMHASFIAGGYGFMFIADFSILDHVLRQLCQLFQVVVNHKLKVDLHWFKHMDIPDEDICKNIRQDGIITIGDNHIAIISNGKLDPAIFEHAFKQVGKLISGEEVSVQLG